MPRSPKPLEKRPPGAGSKPVRHGLKWSMLVTVGRRPDGKQDRRRVSGDTPEECLQRARELQVAAGQGMLATHDRITVGEWVHTWIEAKRSGWAPNTYAKHEQALKLRISPVLGSVKLKDLRPRHVAVWLEGLKTQVGPTTTRMALTTLIAALEHAVRMELLPRNPAQPVKLQTAGVERKVKAWDAQSVTRFLEAARSYRLYPLFYLGFATGLRREELLGLRWKDVSLKDRTLRVEQVLVPVGGSYHIGPPKTRSSRRTVTFGEDVVQVLEEWRKRQAEERRILGDEWQDTGLMFTTSTGQPVHPSDVNRDMRRIIQVYNRKHPDSPLTPLSPHGMRHSHATLLAQKTRQIELVSRRLGHARPSITLDLYRHVEGWELEEVTLPLTELLNPKPRTLN